MKAFLLSVLFLGGLSIPSLRAQDGLVTFAFGNDVSPQEWQPDPGTAIVRGDDHWDLQSKTGKVGISRKVTISNRFLVLSGTGTANITLSLRQPGNPSFIRICKLDYGSGTWRTNWHDANLLPGEYVLGVEAAGPSCQIKQVRLQMAQAVSQDNLPDPEVLGKTRPDPWPARGFMVGTLNAKNAADMKSMGTNVVRLQLGPVTRAKKLNMEFWAAWPIYLEEIAAKVQVAGEAGLKVVVDMHGPPMPDGFAADSHEMWQDPDLDANFCRVWHDLAVRLRPLRQYVWAYDIYNEPLDRSQLPWAPKEWYPLAEKILHSIREVDPDVWIVYESGPGGMSRGFQGLLPLPDTHVIYSFHDYSPGEFTFQGIGYVGDLHQATTDPKLNVPYPLTINGELWDKAHHATLLQPVDDFQRRWKVPIYIGEFSVVRWAPKEDAVRWLQDTIDLFEQRGWSWTYHAFREFNGWSLEHDEQFWQAGMPEPAPSPVETERSKAVRKALQRNGPNPAAAQPPANG